MAENIEKRKKLELNQDTIDVLVANVIPTSKYFEVRFDHLEQQLNQFKTSVDAKFADQDKKNNELKSIVDEKFASQTEKIEQRFVQSDNRLNEFKEDVNKRFEQVDKRFEQVDKRFEQVDVHFGNIENKLDKLIDRIDVKIDAGLRENRGLAVRLFTFAMLFTAISVITLFAKIVGLF